MKLSYWGAILAIGGLCGALEASTEDPLVTDIIYVETNLGAFEIGLFGDVVPKTANNFAKLASVYADTKTVFHRVIDNFVIQGGDFDGNGGHSAYGEKGADPNYGPNFSGLVDENFDIKHDRVGRVSVANAGPNTGGSQFFITLAATPHLNGKHVVFGQVIKGLDVVKAIGKVKTDRNDKPIEDVVIEKCYAKSVREEDGGDDADKAPEVPTPETPDKDVAPEMPATPEAPTTPTPHAATSVAFLPIALFAAVLVVMAVKNKNKVMYAIRGPRYRRVISVNGDST